MIVVSKKDRLLKMNPLRLKQEHVDMFEASPLSSVALSVHFLAPGPNESWGKQQSLVT